MKEKNDFGINIPYKRQIDEFDNVINLSKENPYLNRFPKQPKKNVLVYLILQNGMKIKNKGNNRANSSKRKGKTSRLYQRFIK